MRPPTRSFALHAVTILSTTLLAIPSTFAQESRAQIIVRGHAEELIPATKAKFSVGIVTIAPTSARAGEENARLSKVVTDAILQSGLTPAEILGNHLSVQPQWEYDEKSHRSKRTGFEASNTLDIETVRLGNLGVTVDAALAAGATDVSSIDFSVENAELVRLRVLDQAVRSARKEAEAIAKAGGGGLGDLVLVSTEGLGGDHGVPFAEIPAPAKMAMNRVATNLMPGKIKIEALVQAKWLFLKSTPDGR